MRFVHATLSRMSEPLTGRYIRNFGERLDCAGRVGDHGIRRLLKGKHEQNRQEASHG